MSRRHEYLYALNVGGVDAEALSRVDLEKMRLAGEHPVANFLPRVLGSMSLRPGLQSVLRIPGDVQTRMIPMGLGLGTSRMLLMSAASMRIMGSDAIVVVPPVSTAINSGSWTDVSTSPATATGGATLTFNGTSTASARLRQSVSVGVADQTVSNVLRVVVARGPVVLRFGTTAGGEELMKDATLNEGTHKIGVTPGAGIGTIYVELRADSDVVRQVSQIQFETTLLGGAGDLTLPTIWPTITDVKAIRTCQSLDVMYCGDGIYEPQQVEHRGDTSWSIVAHRTRNGPYSVGASRISLTPTATTGNITVTSSEGLFRAGHAGALMEITSTTGKTVTETFTANGQSTDYVTVQGVAQGRAFYRTGTSSAFVGTVVLERSFEAIEPAVWSTYATYVDGAAAFALTYENDTLDNVTAHYRFRVTAYTSGSCDMTLEYQSGVQVGRVRITQFTNSQNVLAEVLTPLGNLNATRTWRLGTWSYEDGFPRVPVLHDGRLFWFRSDDVFGSVVDDFNNYDDSIVGDSGPLWRSIGASADEGAVWALSQSRLLVGTPSFEATIQASELDEPISPTRYTVRKPSRRGSKDVPAVEHDDGIFFPQRAGGRIYDLSTLSGETRPSTTDLTRLVPNAASAGIVAMAVQQQPDTRLYVVLADGSCLVLTYDRMDKVVAWTTISNPTGFFEDVAVLPGVAQDEVYFVVVRNSTHRYIEKLAPEAAQQSKSTCALLDAHKVLTGSVSSITGGTHVAWKTVQVWTDGVRHPDVAIDGSGNGTLIGGPYARVVYGYRQTASWTSVKLAYAAQLGTAIGQTKIVKGAGLILSKSCLDGITIGGSASMLGPLPEIVDGAVRTPNQFFAHYDQDITPINSDWDADARFVVQVDSAEGPCTIQAVVLDIETRDGSTPGNG